MKPLLLLAAIFLIGLASCTELKNQRGNVVILMDSLKSNYDTVYYNNGSDMISTASVFSAKLSATHSLVLAAQDTIVVSPDTTFVVLTHKYLPHSFADYLLMAGDAARIGYVDGVPLLSVSNRNTKKFDVNYDYYRRKRYPVVYGMQAWDILKSPSTVLAYSLIEKGNYRSSAQVTADFSKRMGKELDDESQWLDSIYGAGEISLPAYSFYESRNRYRRQVLSLNEETTDGIAAKLKNYNDTLYRTDVAGYYRDYYLQISLKYLNTLRPIDKFSLSETYDYIEQGKLYSGMLAENTLAIVLEQILKHSPFEVRKLYFEKFAQMASDTIRVNRLYKRFKYALDKVIVASNDLVLLTPGEKQLLFADVLKMCGGKIVYIDFWASWCEPCIREMKFSKSLRENDRFKDVVFIYLSVDIDKDKWKTACQAAQLDSVFHNYLILNGQSSSVYAEYGIKTLPRYMIFDREGNLLNADAPRPSDEALMVELERL